MKLDLWLLTPDMNTDMETWTEPSSEIEIWCQPSPGSETLKLSRGLWPPDSWPLICPMIPNSACGPEPEPWRKWKLNMNLWVQFSSVQLLTSVQLCDPTDCSMPGFPVHQIPGAYSISCPSDQWCHPTISSSVVPFPCLQSFPTSWSFPVSWFFALGGQSIVVSALAPVLPMNIQGWFPLGLTGWISLQSKGLSRVFSNTTVQKHQLFSAQLSL